MWFLIIIVQVVQIYWRGNKEFILLRVPTGETLMRLVPRMHCKEYMQNQQLFESVGFASSYTKQFKGINRVLSAVRPVNRCRVWFCQGKWTGGMTVVVAKALSVSLHRCLGFKRERTTVPAVQHAYDQTCNQWRIRQDWTERTSDFASSLQQRPIIYIDNNHGR
jgi:hypothetical protein